MMHFNTYMEMCDNLPSHEANGHTYKINQTLLLTVKNGPFLLISLKQYASLFPDRL